MRNILFILLLLFPLYTSCLYAQVGDSLHTKLEYPEDTRLDSLLLNIGGRKIWTPISSFGKKTYLADLQLCEGIISVALDTLCTDFVLASSIDHGEIGRVSIWCTPDNTDFMFSFVKLTGVANLLPPSFVKKGLSRPYIPLWRIPHLRRLSLSPMYNLTAFLDSINTLPNLEWLGLYSSIVTDTKAGLTRADKINWANLRTLRISWNILQNPYYKRNKILYNILQLPKLEELVCYPEVNFDTTLAHTLPNLKRLSISSDVFPSFLAQCPNIEELVLEGNVSDTSPQIAHYAQLFQRWLLQAKHLRVLQFVNFPVANFQPADSLPNAISGHTLTHLLVDRNASLVQAMFEGQQHLFTNLHTIYWRATQYKNAEELYGLVEFLSHFPNVDTLYLNIKKAEELDSLLKKYPLFFQRLKVLYLSDLALFSLDLYETRQRIAPNLQIDVRWKLHLFSDYFEF